MKLRQKLMIGAMLFALLPLIPVSFYISTVGTNILEKTQQGNLININISVKDYIDTFLQQEIRLLKSFVNEFMVQKAGEMLTIGLPDVCQFYLDKYKSIYHDTDIYTSFFVVNTDGKIVADTARVLKGKTVTQKNFFNEAMQGNDAIGDVIHIADNIYSMYIVTPLLLKKKDGNEAIQSGVIGALLRMDNIQKKLYDIVLGQTGYIFLVDGDGFLISHPQVEHIKKKISDLPGFEKVSFVQGKEEFVYLHQNRKKQLVLFMPIETTQWSLVSVIPEIEYLGAIHKMRNIIGVVAILFSVLVFFLTQNYFDKFIHKRLNALTEVTSNISHGELNTSIDTDLITNDEIGFLAHSIDDMRERLKISRDELEDYSRTLQQLRNYLSNIINSMPSVLIGVDTDDNVTQWNSEAHRVTGVSPEAALGQPVWKTFPRLAKEMTLVKEAISDGQVRTAPRQARQEAGETRYEDITIYPLVANGIEGAVIRVDDVTERVRIEEMMVQSEKMISIGGLAAGMAHEINNPLAGMIQNAQVISNRLTKDLPANTKVAEELGLSMSAIKTYMQRRDILKQLDNINRTGRHAAKIVENMLSLARKSKTQKNEQHIEELVEKAIDLAQNDYNLKKKYDFKKIKIIREYDPDIPVVLCEESKIQQVLFNLIKNASEAMTQSNKNPDQKKLVLRLKKLSKMVCIEIEDNGPGMSYKTQKRVFEPFFTTKSVNDGTGLGLSVSYFIIVDDHKGEMEVESIPDVGTKFIIRLPLV